MDLSRYAELFLTESREHMSAINHSLLALERGSEGAVDALFRAVHTIKGMSATMGYAAVAELSHEMETLLERIRRGSRAVTPVVTDVLFMSADALETAIEMSVTGRAGEVDVRKVVILIRGLVSTETAAAAAAPAKPASAASVPTAAGAQTDAAAGVKASAVSPDAVVTVLIRLDPETQLRGVRAFLAVQKAGTAGEVLEVVPSIESLQTEEFAGELSIRLVPRVPLEELERLIRSVGDIESVTVERAGPQRAKPRPTAPAKSEEVVERPAPRRTQTMEAPAEGRSGDDAGAAQPRQRHVRIDLRRLDALMNSIGELVITRGRLEQLSNVIGDPALTESVTQALRLITDLQDQIMTSRMVPVWQVFDRFPRLVRDVARSLGKQVNLTIEGKEIELDRSMLDEIGDPIVHLLRNSIDHGIEKPEVRVAAGKPPAGRLELVAARDRSAVLIRVTDDGRGIDRSKVLDRAIELGMVDASRQELSDDEMIRLISRPGFSTASAVTEVSGRGVGIDAVQNRVRAMGGTVEIRSTPGKGTSIIVRLPLTLAIVRALLARVGDETYALPMTHVSETVELAASAHKSVRGREVLVLRDDVLPLVHLRDAVRMPRDDSRRRQVVVLEVSDRRAGLVVDELTGQQEIVVKQFDAVRESVSLFSGATILADGAPALIVDVGSLL